MVITNNRVDITDGFCGSQMDTLPFTNIQDISFHANILETIIGRGTLTIVSSDDSDPEINLTGQHMKEVFKKLKKAWLKYRSNTVAVTSMHHQRD